MGFFTNPSAGGGDQVMEHRMLHEDKDLHRVITLLNRSQIDFLDKLGKDALLCNQLGPIVWGVTTWLFSSLGPMRYRIALGMMFLFIVVGFTILKKVTIEEK